MANGTQLTVEGLGPVKELNDEALWTSRRDFAWQWVQTAFGQTLIIKRRPELRQVKKETNLESLPRTTSGPGPPAAARSNKRQSTTTTSSAPLDRGVDIDGAVRYAKENIAEDNTLGYTVRRVARDGNLGELIALVSALRDDLRR